jgi:ABC-2 type transport system permease protein
MPLRSVAQQALEHALDSEGYEARTNALRARMLAQYGVPHVEALPFNFRGLALQTDEERGYAIFDRHRARLRARERQQDAVLRAASFILPWLALEQASTALAGTDLRHAEHFADAAESYRRDLVGRMNGHLLHGSGADAGAELWATVPAFAYVTPSGRFALDYAWPCLAILCAWVAITFTVLSLLGQRTRVHGGAT